MRLDSMVKSWVEHREEPSLSLYGNKILQNVKKKKKTLTKKVHKIFHL